MQGRAYERLLKDVVLRKVIGTIPFRCLDKGHYCREQGSHDPSNLFEIAGFSEILMFRQNIFGHPLLVKMTVSNFIGKSLKLVPLLYRCCDASGLDNQSSTIFLLAVTQSQNLLLS